MESTYIWGKISSKLLFLKFNFFCNHVLFHVKTEILKFVMICYELSTKQKKVSYEHLKILMFLLKYKYY